MDCTAVLDTDFFFFPSFHTGVNEYGQNWMQATPDFNERHLKPFAAFVSHLFRKVHFPHP